MYAFRQTRPIRSMIRDLPHAAMSEHNRREGYDVIRKHNFGRILIACDTIIIRVQGSAGRHVWPDLCLEPNRKERDFVRRMPDDV